MTTIESKNNAEEISPEATQSYIMQMLEELSILAHSSGLKEVASLLRATATASQIDTQLEADA